MRLEVPIDQKLSRSSTHYCENIYYWAFLSSAVVSTYNVMTVACDKTLKKLLM